jgi:uncharacterized protein (DUF2147 family)
MVQWLKQASTPKVCPMRVASKILLSLFSLAVLNTASAEPGIDPTGVWLTEAGDAKVRIAHCGTAICGTIIWLKAPINRATEKPQLDDKNPDPAKAHRPIIGLHLFHNMKPAGSKWSGRIYNADNGKTYASNVSLTSSKALKVEGCVLVFCGSETWTRLSGIETAMRDHEVSE